MYGIKDCAEILYLLFQKKKNEIEHFLGKNKINVKFYIFHERYCTVCAK